MYNYQAVVFDLDGTLLNRNLEILTESKMVIRALKSNNVDIYLASGRSHHLMLAYAEELSIDTPLICCNGAYCFELKANNMIHRLPIEKDLVLGLLSQCQSAHVSVRIATAENVYHCDQLACDLFAPGKENTQPVQSAKLHSIATYRSQTFSQMIALMPSLQVYKVVIETNNHLALNDLKVFCETHQLNFTSSSKTTTDITQPQANKARALECLLKTKSYSLDDVVAFGNHSNDLELLASAGLGIAMENSPMELKQIANLVTGHHNEPSIHDTLCLYF
jgi:Cof subfamily protein (haloacid dehalogenase superfamily)